MNAIDKFLNGEQVDIEELKQEIKILREACDAAQNLMVQGLSFHLDIFGFSDWLFHYAHPTSNTQDNK